MRNIILLILVLLLSLISVNGYQQDSIVMLNPNLKVCIDEFVAYSWIPLSDSFIQDLIWVPYGHAYCWPDYYNYLMDVGVKYDFRTAIKEY